MSFLPQPNPSGEELWVILLILLVELSIVIGFAIVAYVVSGLMSKLVRKRKMLVRLLSWTLLLPLCLGLALSCLAFLILSSEQNSILSDPLWIFSCAIINEFVAYPLNVILLGIWLLGILLMFRKSLFVMIKGRNESDE
jgi:hypothetical protein